MATMMNDRKAKRKKKPMLVTIDDKGRVTVSKELRESRGIESGDVFAWVEVDGNLMLVEVDDIPLSATAKRDIALAKKEFAEGGGRSWDDVKRDLEL